MTADDERPHDLALALKLELRFFANTPIFCDCACDFLWVLEPLSIVRQADITLCRKAKGVKVADTHGDSSGERRT
jgi:hypothetical protein